LNPINYFRGRTVASITASLASMVKDLEAHAEAKIAEAQSHAIQVTHFTGLQEAAHVEIAKAKQAAGKIAALFS
jgi:hypothetical protein